MESIELEIDVSDAVPLPGPLHIAASVFLPDADKLTSPPVAIFAFPGGGYSKGYFDLHPPGHKGYSQAEHHVDRGIIFVAADHLGVGASSIPDLTALTLEMAAAANDAAIREIAARLAAGSLKAGFPPLPELVRIAIGQSMGGCITIAMQARHGTCDAIACLGFSAIHTVLPQPTEAARLKGIAANRLFRNQDLRELAAMRGGGDTDFVYPFHMEDVPRDILDADMKGGYPVRKTNPPWGSLTMPVFARLMLSPGYVAQEAAAIRVPVLIAAGGRDVVPDPHAEPAAFKSSNDVSVYVVPGMAHMHNFATTRQLLWHRIAAWSRMVAGHLADVGAERAIAQK
jgi:alpha-beta hydrolase superfamily lysophospholipase